MYELLSIYNPFMVGLLGVLAQPWRVVRQLWGPVVLGGILVNVVISLLSNGTADFTSPTRWVAIRRLLSQPRETTIGAALVLLILVGTFAADRLHERSLRDRRDRAMPWIIYQLRRSSIAWWEGIEVYLNVQSAVVTASARGDTPVVTEICTGLGSFLAAYRDRRGEAEDDYNRARYRALKNLLSGCATYGATSPSAVAYNLGILQSGVLLQAAAVGLPMADADHDLFSGLIRQLRPAPERFEALWIGLRHGLCRGQRGSYLVTYWRTHSAWPADDPRLISRVAEGLASFHVSVWRELLSSWPRERADSAAGDMVMNLYRDISTHLPRDEMFRRELSKRSSVTSLPLTFLDSVHAFVIAAWPTGDETNSVRDAVVHAYEVRRAELLALLNVGAQAVAASSDTR